MDTFFSNDDNLVKLRAELKAWEGTPYRHWTGVRQRGCDCVHFIAGVLIPVGAMKGRYLHIPKYPRDWHLHHGQSLLVDGIKKQIDAVEVDSQRPENGDIILYKFGLHEAHGGIYLDGEVYQALTDMGVQSRRYEDPDFFNRMKRAFRINK